MANNKDNKQKQNRILNKLISRFGQTMDDIYSNTYMIPPQNKFDIESMKKELNKTIDDISDKTVNNTGYRSLSKLYAKETIKDSISPNNTKKNDKIKKTVEDMFSEREYTDNIISVLNENNMVKELDEEIDIILKYMPQLEDALNMKKDAVLSADNFTKDFLNIIYPNSDNKASIDSNISLLKKKYKLVELVEEIYDKTSKYGETFVYCAPYSKVMNNLLKRKNKMNMLGTYANEAAVTTNEINKDGMIENILDFGNMEFISESSVDIKTNIDRKHNIQKTGGLNITLNPYGSPEGIVLEAKAARKVELKLQQTINNITMDDNLEAPEALTDLNKESESNTEVTAAGSIIKILDHENVIPLYINRTFLGAYHIECSSKKLEPKASPFNKPLMNLSNGNTLDASTNKDLMIRKIAAKLSKFIDSKFINTNTDIQDELYSILKFNDMYEENKVNDMKVTFIPPEHIHHIYFKLNTKTHRGVSDLDKSMIPAKLYICMYVTNTLGILTRGHDKRVYYVKNNVDTNISQTLLNTINQIKKGNFGAREISSIKNILGVSGKFNDLVIPMNSSGDAPIQFEIMPGQNIDTKEELMNMLEQMSINGIDMPYEFVQSRQNTDYAVRLTMSNGKVLRMTFKRQSLFEIPISEILNKLYVNEFCEEDDSKSVQLSVEFPPPSFLAMMNTSQLMDNNIQLVDKIIQQETDPNVDSDIYVNKLRKKLLRHYMSIYLDIANIERIKGEAKMEASLEEKEQ